MNAASTIWHSLDEGFFMFWQTLWALILGFTLSGAVQAFVSRRQMRRVMGDHRPAAIVRSSLLGMASSSCSYAASALARSLFAGGADFTAAMVFMIASTNLVLELGIVLWLLIGWQFAAAEFVGGAIMIGLLALILPRVIPTAMIADARRHAGAAAPADDADESDLRGRLRQPARWASAAGYTISDLRMLRREIVIGFVVAGFLAIAVPAHFCNAIFLHGHGAGATIENAAVAPGIAVISFVCSIGNVPLAAALWQHGISFGGVVAFVFADLIAAPLLLIYRKLYGGRVTLRLLGAFWLVMSTAGVLTELIFRALGAIPHQRPRLISPEHFAWDYTSWLNLVFLVVLGGLLWVHAHRDRFGPNTTHAHDPVCGMQVERTHPGAVLDTADGRMYFCSGHCQGIYQREHQTTAATERTP
jgi:uncharacterized membrane protein YraQ (UPF0718 family)/YHS domain-containing protein